MRVTISTLNFPDNLIGQFWCVKFYLNTYAFKFYDVRLQPVDIYDSFWFCEEKQSNFVDVVHQVCNLYDFTKVT